MDNPREVRIWRSPYEVHTVIAEVEVADQMRQDFKSELATPQSYDVIYSGKRDGSGGLGCCLTIAWADAEISGMMVTDYNTTSGAKDIIARTMFSGGGYFDYFVAAGQVVQMKQDFVNLLTIPQEYQIATDADPRGQTGFAAKLILRLPNLVGFKFINVIPEPEP